ncbi:hypothetical protein BCV69DRAFT_279629 [Microstroma glucosiphilum]|uniref:EthD domain-containing protein n=1 Tax=Pseudomicrostroma glucosiphilum TaxID=1684307 RepID=A0A316UH80_9BASI|nr:hypothetical protein BCV69DRAFT_279629 [Pseudomicrostroma glucosiphilum]PWN23701.1 hypothetical protein BCV69DRAFT_279629 [Pseudomicrostroma glucosiphilum]
MRLTILSKNLPGQSEEQFLHEFHTVHAQQTGATAANTGILHEYIQGFAPALRRERPDLRLPLPKGPVEMFSSAQLTWPSTGVMRGLFGSSVYQNEAGAHVFAEPNRVYVTDNLEEEDIQVRQSGQVRLLCLLSPASDEAFRASWDKHRDLVRSLPIQPKLYQRHLSLCLTRGETASLFKNTPFDIGHGNIIDGGLEEFLFDSVDELGSFLAVSFEKLRESYSSFVKQDASSAYVFDQKMVYASRQRGIYQLVVGAVVGTVFSLKGSLGI